MNEQAMNPLNQIAELLNSTNLLSPTKSSNFGKQEGVGNAIYDCSPYVLLYQQMQLEQSFYEGIAKQYCLCDMVSFPQVGAPQKLKTNESDCPKSRSTEGSNIEEAGIENGFMSRREVIPAYNYSLCFRDRYDAWDKQVI